MRILLWIPLALGVSVLTAGCPQLGYPSGDTVPYNPKATSGDVDVRRDIQFADIPVPRGFLLRRDDSYSFQGRSFRMGTFKYEGTAGLQTTHAFYCGQMPVSGWTHLESGKARDALSATHLYAKGRERCRVEIRSVEDATEVFVQVYVDRDDTTASRNAWPSPGDEG